MTRVLEPRAAAAKSLSNMMDQATVTSNSPQDKNKDASNDFTPKRNKNSHTTVRKIPMQKEFRRTRSDQGTDVVHADWKINANGNATIRSAR